MIRLQKVLAERGVASRRRAEELIRAGRVRVEGQVVTTLGTKVEGDARITVDDMPTRAATTRYIALNKPKGVVSTASDERGRRTVVDLIELEERLYPVGRLDADSEGLVLLTNDGDWAERVLHPRYGHEREYEVTVFGDLTTLAIDALRTGVRLEEGVARAGRVDILTRSNRASRLRVVLRTGWKRQLRRMLASVDLRTDRLVRVRIGSLVLGKLKPGDWRELNPREIAALAEPAGAHAGVRTAPRPGRRAQERARDAVAAKILAATAAAPKPHARVVSASAPPRPTRARRPLPRLPGLRRAAPTRLVNRRPQRQPSRAPRPSRAPVRPR